MIRKLSLSDRDAFLRMSRAFFGSDAVLYDIPDQFHHITFDELVNDSPYTECWVLVADEAAITKRGAGQEACGEVVGYALTATTWSREAGGPAVWLEEFYIEPDWRGAGLAAEFFAWWIPHLKAQTPAVARVRLEVEPENELAVSIYRHWGFKPMKYDSWAIDFRL